MIHFDRVFDGGEDLLLAIRNMAEREGAQPENLGFSIVVDPYKAAAYMFYLNSQRKTLQKELDELRASISSAAATATAKK